MHTLDDLEYASFSEVLTEVKDVAIFDLGRYVVRLPKPYRDILLPEPDGIYMQGVLEPVLTFSAKTAYYTKKQYEHAPKFPDILSFDNFIRSRQAVVDRNGKLIHICPVLAKDLFSKECSFNYSAIHLAAISVFDLLQQLHRHTKPTTTLTSSQLNEHNYVKEGSLKDRDYNDQPGIIKLEERVMDFVGRDVQHQYHLRLQNTTLILEKGNDYRVIEYYRERFEKLEATELFDHVSESFR